MAKKVSAKAQRSLEILEEGRRKVDRIYALVEQYAATKKGQAAFAPMISRAATDLGRLFMNNGLGTMADSANQIVMLVRRGVTQSQIRSLRELTGSLRAAIERQEKMVLEIDAMEKESSD